MIDPKLLPEFLEQLKRLNGNMETLHLDAEKFASMHGDLRTLIMILKQTGDRIKALPLVAKHLAIFNSILLQTKKTSGMVGVVQSLVTTLVEAIKRGG